MNNSMRRLVRLMTVLFLLGVGALISWRWWPLPRERVYSIYREYGRWRTLSGLVSYVHRSSEHFDLYYTASDQPMAEMILKTAERLIDPVVHSVGYSPPNRVPIILYPSREAMQQAFGWGKSDSAMGVYWAGSIRLLSPNVWLGEESPSLQANVFQKLNPLAHELTHYLLDYRTNGNYPRWFTEGLAQRVEFEATGYLWLERSSHLQQPLYSLSDLEDRFDQLPNQPLAYRLSYLLVDFIARMYGEEALDDLIDLLSSGHRFSPAFRKATGTSLNAVDAEFRSWIEEHKAEIDSQSH